MKKVILGLGLMVTALSGCAGSGQNVVELFPVPQAEADWIVEGKPVEFESESWYPQDNIDILLDSEVYLLGESQGVQIFASKVDVKPYGRLYTKFGQHKFRIFTKKVVK